MTDMSATPEELRRPASAWERFARRFEYFYAMFAIMIYEGALTQSFRYYRGEDRLLAGETEITATVAQAIILSLLVLLLWVKRRRFIQALRDMVPYMIILSLCAISTVWSDYPFPTLRRSVTLSSCVFFGVYCYLTFGLRGTVALVGRATVILALMSLVVFVAIPQVGHETAFGYESAMRGVYSQKNNMGEAMLLAISCYVYLFIDGSLSPWRAVGTVGLLMFCILLSQSATSLVLASIVIAVGAIFYSSRNWRLRLVLVYFFAVVAVLVAVFLVADSAAVFAVLNRDPSFTGRLPLWDMSMQAIMRRPLLGYGYSGFWNQDSLIVQQIWQAIAWEAPSAHNGYLDIILQIGFLGLGFYAWVWGKTIVLSLSAWRESSLPEAQWILLFMLINVLLNLDEGPLPYPDQFTVLMPGVLLLLEAWRRDRRRQALPVGGRRPAPQVFAGGRWHAGQRS